MAKADAILALVRAHLAGDQERFRATVLSMAANAESTSWRLAKGLRDLAARIPSVAQMLPLPSGAGNYLTLVPARHKLADMFLDPDAFASVQRILIEHRERDKLATHGFRPMRKMLFSGPPGVGKTMCASALADQLELPLYRVELHAVIEQYMGATAAHLAKVFVSIGSVRGVYLFDEFDALGAARTASEKDVGEMRRVVNSLLQFIEQDDSDSLIICATNHVQLLDRAMFRRFDRVIEFGMPTEDVAKNLIEAELQDNNFSAIDWSTLVSVAVRVGHADIVAACNVVQKDAILFDKAIRVPDLVRELSARRVQVESAVIVS